MQHKLKLLFPTLALSRSGLRVEVSMVTSSQPDSSSSPTAIQFYLI